MGEATATLDVRAEHEKGHVRITAVKVLGLKQHGGQCLVKIESDAGLYGIGEAGASAHVVRAHLHKLAPMLIGQDPLEIEKLYGQLTGLMHSDMAPIPTISGLDIALWDLAGKILNLPVSSLLTGRVREEVALYMNTAGPADWRDRGSCEAWAAEIKAHPYHWKTVKLGFERLMGQGFPPDRYGVAQRSQTLTRPELALVRRFYENCRAALGDDTDLIVHCHNEWDLPSAIGLAEAVAPSQPLWLEDALPVPYSEAWPALKRASPVRIMTGEKLELSRQFLPFLANGALDVIHPDLAYAGGITGSRKIADLAELFYVPLVTHCVGTLVHMLATAHFGASVRNFMMSETRLAHAGHLVEQIGMEPLVVVDGRLRVPSGPGLGITLNPDVIRENLAEGECYWD
jgi:L-alanine-DL-glutamate epimerase-like enolase superfamily enzyme